MPELPEVETVRCQLAPVLTGGTFIGVEKTEPFILRDCTEVEFRALLPGQRVETVERLGKFIIVRTEGRAEVYLTLHLGMTGQVLVRGSDSTPAGERLEIHPHTRFLLRLRNAQGTTDLIEFRDARKFGRVHLTLGSPPSRLQGLGPDAWQGDWDAGYLGARLRGRRAPLKAFLLDQRHLAGIGNIYADEILWWTELSPLREAGSLNEVEVDTLAGEIRSRLEDGVRRLGCSLSDFVDTEGRPGTFQDHLRAYQRQGLPCVRCGVTMVRVVVAGRGTAYCPGCQR